MNKSSLCPNVYELPLAIEEMLKAAVSAVSMHPSSMDKDTGKEIPVRP